MFTAYDRATAALIQRYRDLHTSIPLDPSGRLEKNQIMENVLPGIGFPDFGPDLAEGDGRELDGHFLAVHSSSALCVNSFARFKACPNLLPLGGSVGIPPFIFEGKCAVGLTGRSGQHPPNLEVLAKSRTEILGIESKCTETLREKLPKFSDAYERDILDDRRSGAWFSVMQAITSGTETYRYLDAAQLVKHAFGIANIDRLEGTPLRPAKLVYVYWEPENASDVPECLAHRAELSRFTEVVAGGYPSFASISYPELWLEWEDRAEPDWLRRHVGALRRRYSVRI
jgi:hypothetical protein